MIKFKNAQVNSVDLESSIRKFNITLESGAPLDVRFRGRGKDQQTELEEELDKVTQLIGQKVNVIAQPVLWRLGDRKGTIYFLVHIHNKEEETS